MPYDPKTDYAAPGFQPTKDDPLCARCGWPKHHHFGGMGALAFEPTEDRCPAFAEPAPIHVRTPATRRQQADD